MAFDLATAKPVGDSSSDQAPAKPRGKFDLATAKPVGVPGNGGGGAAPFNAGSAAAAAGYGRGGRAPTPETLAAMRDNALTRTVQGAIDDPAAVATAGAAGFNRGVADVAGIPADTGQNILDLGKVALGPIYNVATRKPGTVPVAKPGPYGSGRSLDVDENGNLVPTRVGASEDIPDWLLPPDRRYVVGTGDYNAALLDKASAAVGGGPVTVNPAPENPAARLVYGTARAVPGALTGRQALASGAGGAAQTVVAEAGGDPALQAIAGLGGNRAIESTPPRAQAPRAATPEQPKTGGETIRVYHGTDAPEFNQFRTGSAQGWGNGIYLTDTPEAASQFGKRIIAADVTLKNPYRGGGIDETVLENTQAWQKIKDKYASAHDAWKEDGRFAGEALRELGYDGIITEGTNDVQGKEVVAFSPSQVRIVKGGEGAAASTGSADLRNVPDAIKSESFDDVDSAMRNTDQRFPRVQVGSKVSGLEVLPDVPNTSSISGVSNDYEVLPGIREVPMSAFENPGGGYVSKTDRDRVRTLSGQLKESGQIKPLIVVRDADGMYVLEGGHRLSALHANGARSVPALVVLDVEGDLVKTQQAPTPENAAQAALPQKSAPAPMTATAAPRSTMYTDLEGSTPRKPPKFVEKVPQAEGGQSLGIGEQARRKDILRRVGVGELRNSAVQGDAKAAATDYQMSKLDNAQGQHMSRVMQSEREALSNFAERVAEDTGGTRGTDQAANLQRGTNIVAPLDGIRDFFDNRTKALYKVADQRAKGKPFDTAKTREIVADKSEFLGTTEGEALLRGVRARMEKLGMTDADGTPQRTTVQQAERLKQYLGNQWTQRTSHLIKRLKEAIDDDVLSAAGEDIYKRARALRAERARLLDDPQGIARILDSEGPQGINRAVAVERIGDVMSTLPVAQFSHIVSVLTNAPAELRGPAQAALAEIKSHFANKVAEIGNKTQAQWNSKGVSNYLNDNSARLRVLFSPEELQRFADLNDAGHILKFDSSYPGAAVQAHNLTRARAVEGMMTVAGTTVGGAMAGPVGMAAGAAFGNALGHRFSKGITERAGLKAAKKRTTDLRAEDRNALSLE